MGNSTIEAIQQQLDETKRKRTAAHVRLTVANGSIADLSLQLQRSEQNRDKALSTLDNLNSDIRFLQDKIKEIRETSTTTKLVPGKCWTNHTPEPGYVSSGILFNNMKRLRR